jgi:hypothetical protein
MDGFQKAAREKFPYGEITGSGPFAVVSKCTRRWHIRLYKVAANAIEAEQKPCRAFLCKGTAQHFQVTLYVPKDAV